MFFDLQPLESRRLLSSSLSGIFQDPTIKSDQQAVNAAMKTLVTDQRAGRKTIAADQKAVRTEYQKLITDKGQDAVDAALQPLQTQLRTDEKAKTKVLRNANKDLSTTKHSFTKTILADTRVWRQAEKDGSGADAAKAQLDKDRAAEQSALDPIRDNITALGNKYRPIITADHDAITKELETLDPALTPLYTKLDSDTTALNTSLTTDAKAVGTASATLASAIEAYRKAHPTDTTATA